MKGKYDNIELAKDFRTVLEVHKENMNKNDAHDIGVIS